jgi:hypothetical protein
MTIYYLLFTYYGLKLLIPDNIWFHVQITYSLLKNTAINIYFFRLTRIIKVLEQIEWKINIFSYDLTVNLILMIDCFHGYINKIK